MMSSISIALSGLNAAQLSLRAAGHNIANASTEGFRRQQVATSAATDGGVSTSLTQALAPGASLEADLVAQHQARNGFLANLTVFKAAVRSTDALLDIAG